MKKESQELATMKKESQELATVEQAGLSADMAGMFDLKANMEGVEARLPRIGIIHQAQMFEMPDGEKVKSFSGIILDVSRTNAFWSESFDNSGGGSPPQCFSLDGVISDPTSEDRQTVNCADCPQNQYGSDSKRGKQCKNMKKIHILADGEMLPQLLIVPPSNLRVVDLYVSLLTSKGLPYQLVNTVFALKTVTNKDGIKYAELVMTIAGKITEMSEAQKIKAFVTQWLPIMHRQIVTPADSNAGNIPF